MQNVKWPLDRMITEGTSGTCPECGSTEKRAFFGLGLKMGCIQPKCENYWKRVKKCGLEALSELSPEALMCKNKLDSSTYEEKLFGEKVIDAIVKAKQNKDPRLKGLFYLEPVDLGLKLKVDNSNKKQYHIYYEDEHIASMKMSACDFFKLFYWIALTYFPEEGLYWSSGVDPIKKKD